MIFLPNTEVQFIPGRFLENESQDIVWLPKLARPKIYSQMAVSSAVDSQGSNLTLTWGCLMKKGPFGQRNRLPEVPDSGRQIDGLLVLPTRFSLPLGCHLRLVFRDQVPTFASSNVVFGG